MADNRRQRVVKCADDSKKCEWCSDGVARLEVMILTTAVRAAASLHSDSTAPYLARVQNVYLPICLACAGSLFDELGAAI